MVHGWLGAWCAAEGLRQRMDRRRAEELDHRDILVEFFAQLAVDLDQQEGGPPDFEEVVVNTYGSKLEYLLPDARNYVLQVGLRWHVVNHQIGTLALGGWQGAPIDFAIRQ
jgi:hypothetical protein